MRVWMAIFGAACAIGSAIGLFAVFAGIEYESARSETFVVNYPWFFLVFLSWFVPISVSASLAFALILWAVRGLRFLLRWLRSVHQPKFQSEK